MLGKIERIREIRLGALAGPEIGCGTALQIDPPGIQKLVMVEPLQAGGLTSTAQDLGSDRVTQDFASSALHELIHAGESKRRLCPTFRIFT